MIVVRAAKISLVAAIALFASLVAFGNLTDYNTNFVFVEHVLSIRVRARQHHRSTLAVQEARLHEANAAKVLKEKISGAASNRAQLYWLLKTIDAGDAVLVTRLDRLARSTRDLLNVVDKITKAGATFRSLRDAWADTTTAHARLMLTVLGGLAEFRTRTNSCKDGRGSRSGEGERRPYGTSL